MPQAVGSFGGHMGTGMAEVLATRAVLAVLLLMCVDATAPVTTRERAKARRTFFMV